LSDSIGRISVPDPVASGLTFPLVTDFGYGMVRPWPVIVHRFGELAERAEQRFQVGFGPRKFPFRRDIISYSERAALFDFFEQVQGSFQSFAYNAPLPDQTTATYQATFEQQPLSIEELTGWCRAGFNLVECPDPAGAPVFSVSETCLRFPSSTLKTALLSQVQQIVPLVHIRVREGAVPDIYLSDRRCTVGGQLYLPRLLNLGEPGSDVIVSQSISGAADNVQFSFGNADRTMSALANDTDLRYGSIDLCLYHINSQRLLQLWKGSIISFTIDGSSIFRLQASDGLYQVTQQYPPRVVSRTCWKTFDDGLNCPYSTQGSGGDPTQCDFYFDSPKGCLSHGMGRYFGGHPALPQSVSVKDNSTGVAGFGRNVVTSTSIVSDSIWGQALPEHWCNDDGDPGKALLINALMVAVRDESDFVDGLAIVGAGPIGLYAGMLVYKNADGYRYIIAPMLDGQTPHGFKVDSQLNVVTDTTLGIREVVGDDPNTAPFGLGAGNPPNWGPALAAGTAFLELRRSDAPGIQPSTTEGHQMQVPISKGLSGWTWNGSDVRSSVSGLTNPFWIAANSFLRVLGINTASSSAQLAAFVRSSLFVGDGSGAAEIADTLVTPIFGTGTEKQFRFQGTIAQQKAFRDWLGEILATGLGFFTWEFGRLKFGIRINASAVEAFTRGNILFQSLMLQPIDAQFEKLIIDYADQAYQYQANTAEYEDKSHTAYYGRAGSPLTARQHMVGTSTVSQASRLAAVRTREEIGGVNAAEWGAARTARWLTTILALNTEVGQVVSMTHPDIPGGSGNFRIQSWTLKKDYSIEIEARTVTASMYDLTVGPKPVDTPALPLPALFYPVPQGQWAPYQVQAPSDDALFPSEWNFEATHSYKNMADGTALANVSASGKLTVNQYIPNCGAPVIHSGAITQSSTGGSIPGGLTLRVSVVARDGSGRCSPPSEVALIQIPVGTNTNQFSLTGIQWPAVTGLTSFEVFLSDADDLICQQQSGSLVESPATVYSPTSVAVNGPFLRSTWALPNSKVRKIRIKEKHLIHGAAFGAPADSVVGHTVVAGQTIDVAAIDNWAGRALVVVGRQGASVPFLTFSITAFNPATGTFTLAQDAQASGMLAGDVFGACFKGYDNSGSPNVLTDTGISNALNLDVNTGAPTPHSGMSTNQDKGYIVRVIAGKSRGQMAKIVSNNATSWTLDKDLPIDATSVWIVESGAWEYRVDSNPVDNVSPTLETVVTVPTDNFQRQLMLLAGFTVTDDPEAESDETDAPIRMIYVFGSSGATGLFIDGFFILSIASNHVAIETNNGKNQKLTLNQATRVTIDNPTHGGSAPTAGDWLALYILQDATGGRPTPAWGTAFGSDVSGQVLDPTPSTRSAYQLTYHDDGKWHLDSFITGQPLT
jgi:hypothetical protein